MKFFSVSDPSLTKTLAYQFMLKAYELCGTELGMGIFQAAPNMTLGSIPKYLSVKKDRLAGITELYADYLAGRMVKTHIGYSENGFIYLPDTKPNPDYQGWSAGTPRDPGVLRNYVANSEKPESYEELLNLAASEINVTVQPC